MIPTLINFEAKALPFPKYLFSEHAILQVSPEKWWKQLKFLDADTLQLIVSFLTAKDSSAGVERVFSSFGLVQSKLRNHLGNEKAKTFTNWDVFISLFVIKTVLYKGTKIKQPGRLSNYPLIKSQVLVNLPRTISERYVRLQKIHF